MNRRQFIASAVGAAVVTPALAAEPLDYFVNPMHTAPCAWWASPAISVELEWQEFMTRTIACVFDMSPFLLPKGQQIANAMRQRDAWLKETT